MRILNTYEFCINYDYQDCHSKIMIIAYANPDGLWDKVQTDDFFKMVTMWILFSSMYQAINLMTSFTWRRCVIRSSSEMLVSKNEVRCLLKTFPWELNIGYYEAHFYTSINEFQEVYSKLINFQVIEQRWEIFPSMFY